ncbi:MAG: CsgG/HfaB family protein [Treponema sp.]|jgi:TolB-like protein|nr:CsgG/HfaB family protein [Treponema sp.]
MMQKKFILTVLTVLSPFFVFAQESNVLSQINRAVEKRGSVTVVVMDFVNVDGRQSVLGRYLAEEAIKYLIKTNNIKVVERSQLESIVQEMEFQTSGYVSEESSAVIGDMLGADVIVQGNLTRTGRRIEVKLKVLDIRTAEILAMGSSELSGAKYLRMYNDILGD